MQIAGFVKLYQSKSDEELIQLAVEQEQLTCEARLALQGELSKRAISITHRSEVSHDVDPSISAERLQTGDGLDEGVRDFMTEVLRTYHSHFWLFFKIPAPAVIITTIAVITARNEVREISRHLPRGFELVGHKTEIWEMSLLNFLAWILSWIAFSFVFGAICIAAEENAAGFTASAVRFFLNIRERLLPFLRISLLLLALVVVAEAAWVAFASGVFWVLHQWRMHATGLLFPTVWYGFAYLAVLGVSRFFLAVRPTLVLRFR